MMRDTRKMKCAFFDFACCEGCQLTVLELLQGQLDDFLRYFTPVLWREAMSEKSDDYEVAFCEGSITRGDDVDRIETIRATARILVTLGTCASIGCHNVLKNKWSMAQVVQKVYGENGSHITTIPARPIAAVVPVDYQIYGCPVSMPELREVLASIVAGKAYRPAERPVCVECKWNDNLCVYEKGLICMGPVTRCGCNAICTSYGDACQGCRGVMAEANGAATLKVLTAKHNHAIMRRAAREGTIEPAQIEAMYALYNSWPEHRIKEIMQS